MPLESLTFGCRLNTVESAVMAERAAGAGVADALLVNTCAVTAEAVRQARQAIRRAKRERPERKIVVSGCAAQTDPKMFAAMPEVDLVLGNHEKLQAESYRRVTVDHPPGPPPDVVMPGLDPGIHSITPSDGRDRHGMDRRVKPGDDDSGVTEAPPDRGIGQEDKVLVGDIFSVRENTPHRLEKFS